MTLDARTKEHVAKLVAAAPPLTREIRDRLTVILHPDVLARRPVRRSA